MFTLGWGAGSSLLQNEILKKKNRFYNHYYIKCSALFALQLISTNEIT
jgi:hypothetical protein